MPHILILEGADAYADPWHPFPATTASIAAALAPFGSVRARRDVDAALGELFDIALPDLLVFNVGNAGPLAPPTGARESLVRAADLGMPILAVHSSATAFPGWGEWSSLIGGHWSRGHTFHPPASRCRIDLTAAAGSLDEGERSFATEDERYANLVLEPESEPLAGHTEDGVWHPLAWRFSRGPRRAAYVGLGHDEGAYRSDGARALLTATARGLLEG